MEHITPQQMIAFYDELLMQKEAGFFGKLRGGLSSLSKNPKVRAAAGLAGSVLPSRYGGQMALGAGAGAVGGGLAAEEGKGVSGALRGALLGAGLAGGRILATSKGRKAVGTGLRNFGTKQRYGFTGSFGKGVGKSREAQLAQAQKVGLVPKAVDPSAKEFASLSKKRGMFRPDSAQERAIRKATEAHSTGRQAFERGYMSAPGVAKALVREPGKLLRSSWKRGGALGKGFAGLGAYETASGFAEKPTEGGPGRLEKGLRGAGGTVGWLTAPATLGAGMLVGTAGGSIGGRIGRMGDKAISALRGGKQRAPSPSYYPQQGGM